MLNVTALVEGRLYWNVVVVIVVCVVVAARNLLLRLFIVVITPHYLTPPGAGVTDSVMDIVRYPTLLVVPNV